MQQHLDTNARHSSKNALTLNPRATVEEGIEVRAFLEKCRDTSQRKKKYVSDGCHVRSTVPCHCLHRIVYQTKALFVKQRHTPQRQNAL
jgi:hypothetical protein